MFTLFVIYMDHRLENKVKFEMQRLVEVKQSFDKLKVEGEDN
jgi:hypothetical protein